MSQLNEIRQQIASIGQTRQITQAMQRIAFIKMRRAKERALMLRPYARNLNRIVARLMTVETEYRPALLVHRQPARRIGIIVVSTDKGLCGALNARLLHLAIGQIDSWRRAGCEVSVTVIGARGLGALRRAGADIVAQAIHVGEFDPGSAEALMGAVAVPLHQFIDGAIDALHVGANHFVNSLQYEPVLMRFLPFDPRILELPAPGGSVDYLYEPEPGPVIDAVLLRYVETMILRAIAENAACEQSARMTAMKAATENASHLIEELTVQYHKRRQEVITRELAEISAGVEALRGN
jgi:F-type H+-transporting ATPase subunit gamma